MRTYDFDQIIDRRGTCSLKYLTGSGPNERGDLIPLWVADMDLRSPDEVIRAIEERAAHGIFGYSMEDGSYLDALEGWFARRYGWKIRREWNTIVPGVVYGIVCAIRALTGPGDAVLIQEPVYYPFREMIEKNGRVCINNQLVLSNGTYHMDTDELEKLIRGSGVRAMILCSPHNPVGRVWTREELSDVDRICRRNGVHLIVDEIHCDFVYPGHVFNPFAALGEESLGNAVICTSPSKTFNLAGLQISNILIADPAVRRAFRAENDANGSGPVNPVSLAAAKAAFLHGDEWLEELLEYLSGNLSYVRSFLTSRLPELRLIEPEGTYLLWIDFSSAAGSSEQLRALVRDRARLWLDDGVKFSRMSPLFQRMNIACPRSVLGRAMGQLEEAIRKTPA